MYLYIKVSRIQSCVYNEALHKVKGPQMRGRLQDGHHEVRDVSPQHLVELLFPTLTVFVVDALGALGGQFNHEVIPGSPL